MNNAIKEINQDLNLFLNSTGMTKKEVETYYFIFYYISKFGFSPSVKEVSEGTHVNSRGSAHRYILSLEKKGLIFRKSGSHCRWIQIKKNNYLNTESGNPYKPLQDTLQNYLKLSELCLTRNEAKVYRFVIDFIMEHGYSPSIREITEFRGLKSNTATFNLVHKIKEKGLFVRRYNRRIQLATYRQRE